MGNLHYFAFSEKKALDLAPKNNKGIVEIVLEDEYEESDYEETSHLMKRGSISLRDLQGEEFIIDNANEDIKGD